MADAVILPTARVLNRAAARNEEPSRHGNLDGEAVYYKGMTGEAEDNDNTAQETPDWGHRKNMSLDDISAAQRAPSAMDGDSTSNSANNGTGGAANASNTLSGASGASSISK